MLKPNFWPLGGPKCFFVMLNIFKHWFTLAAFFVMVLSVTDNRFYSGPWFSLHVTCHMSMEMFLVLLTIRLSWDISSEKFYYSGKRAIKTPELHSIIDEINIHFFGKNCYCISKKDIEKLCLQVFSEDFLKWQIYKTTNSFNGYFL